jgi:hypothetical protein
LWRVSCERVRQPSNCAVYVVPSSPSPSMLPHTSSLLPLSLLQADVVFTGHNPSSAAASYSGGAHPSPPPSPAAAAAAAPPPPPAAAAEGPRSGLLLLLAKLVQHLEGVTVPGVMEALGGSTWGRSGRAALGDEPPVFMAGEVARRLGTAASEWKGEEGEEGGPGRREPGERDRAGGRGGDGRLGGAGWPEWVMHDKRQHRAGL